MAAMEQSLIEQYKDVYVFAQQVDNEISPIAFELLGKAKDLANDLGEKVVAVLIGYNVKGLADQLAVYGADKVIGSIPYRALYTCSGICDQRVQAGDHAGRRYSDRT